MTAKKFILIYGVIILIYGILFLFLTNTADNIYGTADTATPATTALVKYLGIVFLAAGIMCIVAKDANASHGRKGILAFIAVNSLIFLIFSIMSVAAGTVSGTMGYVDLIVQVVFTAGGAYFYSKEKIE